MKKFNLITFDISGTLLTFRKSIGEIYSDAAKHFGITVDPAIITKRVDRHMSEMCQQHPNYGLNSGLGWQNWWRMVVSKSFDSIEINGQHSKYLAQLSDHLIKNFSNKNEYKLMEGSVDILEFLEKKGVHTGVISNFDPRLHTILEDIGIRKYFTFVITSYEAGFLKPDERIFKEAEKKYIDLGNKFDRSTTVHIGDSLKYDYCGARNAGWSAILIDPSKEKNCAERNKEYSKCQSTITIDHHVMGDQR
ncbi:haloacid dehalogenase-like hydrolase domain-containing protein 3 [Halyomorpha halys]|uniref:haloacid dehalogenase-like hydrolase domain-containing protein 3 n=1 Tax=Halyomorpha halys TaxID=286706 RepID=UPI0006D4D129|nr:haloacid dehalogenase-like hydrolase domain-containing protein 3 [Halyomorpha halys]